VDAAARRAGRRLWIAFWILFVAIGVGRAWDAYWHVTRPFDTFFSPPHLFTYLTTGLAGGLVASLLFDRELRDRFGAGPRAPLLGDVPWPLLLALGGFATLLLAGGLDAVWHTRFGLDETPWSTPHAMIGWGLLVIFLGFLSARLALGRPAWPVALLLGFFALGFTPTPFLGPLYGNNTPETVRAVAEIPVLAQQPAAQHTYRIFLAWNLDRTNPLLLPLGALWAAAALALARGIDGRARSWLLAAAIWSLLTLRGEPREAQWLERFEPLVADPATWLPLPLFFAALAFWLLRQLRLPAPLGWAGAGLVFAVVANAWWGPHRAAGLLAPLAAAAAVLGASIGGWLADTVARPRGATVAGLLALGVAVPFATGLLDLYLRRATP
jgi:hypothetical protein